MAAVQAGDPVTLAGVLRRQRAHLLRELRGLADARVHVSSAVVSLLITAAELHVRADLGVVDAAEQSFEPELGAAQRQSAPAGSGEASRSESRPARGEAESAMG